MFKKRHVLISLILAIVGNLSMVVTPYYLGLAIDQMLGKNAVDFMLVRRYLLIAVGLYGISFLFVWLSNNVAFQMASDVVYKIREKIQNKLAH
ncbi:MAG TPA: ABC transporter transmembrane domain-containing protein, partial [Erysipelothrix sp.]|nr:ABC transporter transmembrane domain-containing protein [Erysipelothrix sp.]